MEIAATLPAPVLPYRSIKKREQAPLLQGLEKKIVLFLIKLRVVCIACITLKHPGRIVKTLNRLVKLRSNIWAGDLKKIYRVGGKYYFNQYTPGWPSKAHDLLIKDELKRQSRPNEVERLSFVFLAITRKCPLRCEHCLEWNNLNQPETFTRQELFQTIDMLHKDGVLQVHFSGGEPMVRFKDLLQLIRFASRKMESWVLTSGFNFSRKNAELLKQVGCTGIVVSLDHYQAEKHNQFRGSDSFDNATGAVNIALQTGFVVSLSVCATKEFIEEGSMMPYLEFAKSLGVHFVQVLEPKEVGRYKGKDVLLGKRHITELDAIFKLVNHHKSFRDYPTMLYHGYHQRKVGCFSGSRSLYVDSAGNVHACPFCQNHLYNIIDWIRNGHTRLPEYESGCPRYGLMT